MLEEKKAVIIDAVNKHDEALDDSKLVDEMFNFLPRTDSVNDNHVGPTAFKDLENHRDQASDTESENMIPVPHEDDQEDLTEYTFQKFATTYFQCNVGYQYQRKPIKQPLLPLTAQGDCNGSHCLMDYDSSLHGRSRLNPSSIRCREIMFLS